MKLPKEAQDALNNARKRYEDERARMTPAERVADDEKAEAFDRKIAKADRADADVDLVLLRITVPHVNAVEWWFVEPAQIKKSAWRPIIEQHLRASTPLIKIRLMMRTARATAFAWPLSDVILQRRVYATGTQATTLREAMEDRFSVHSRMLIRLSPIRSLAVLGSLDTSTSRPDETQPRHGAWLHAASAPRLGVSDQRRRPTNTRA